MSYSSQVGQKSFTAAEGTSLPVPKTKESNGCICGLIVSALSAIGNLLRKIASIFCCCVFKGAEKKGEQLKMEKNGGMPPALDLFVEFGKACKEGNIEEAAKFIKLLGGNKVAIAGGPLVGERGICVDRPLYTGLCGTVSGDPDTKANRLEIARQILERDPALLDSDFVCTVVDDVMCSKDYKDFIPLFIERGFGFKVVIDKTSGETLFDWLVQGAVSEKDSEKLEWLLQLEGVDPKTEKYLQAKGYTSEFIDRYRKPSDGQN